MPPPQERPPAKLKARIDLPVRRLALPSPAQWRLSTRVAVAIGGLLLLLQAMVVAASFRQADAQRRAAIADNVAVGQAIAIVADGFLRDLDSTTLAMALALGSAARPLNQDNFGPYLGQVFQEYGVLRSLFVTDSDGRVIISYSGSGLGLDLSSRPYVKALQAGANKVVSDDLQGTQSGNPTVTFARVIPRGATAPRAYLIAAYYPGTVVEHLPRALPPDATVRLLSRSGMVLFDSRDPTRIGTRLDPFGPPGLAQALAGVAAHAEHQVGADGARQFTVYVPQLGTGWVVALARPQSVLDDVWRLQMLYQIGGAAFVLFGALVGAVLITRRITRPLAELEAVALGITRGDTPAVPSGHAPEVSRLTAAFEVMAQAISAREDALAQFGRQQEALARLGEAALREPSLPELFQCAVNTVHETLHVPIVALLQRLSPAKGLLNVAGVGWKAGIVGHVTVPSGRGSLAGYTLEAGEPIVVRDFTTEERFAVPAVLREHGAASGLAVAVPEKDRPFGVLAAFSITPRSFSDDDVHFLQAAASLIGVSLERTKAEADRYNLLLEVQQASQAREQFLAAAAHDLQNPLTALKGWVQLVARGSEDPTFLSRALSEMDETITRMARILGELIDTARLASAGQLVLECAPVDLTSLAGGAVSSAQRLSDRHEIRLARPQEPLLGLWDGARLERVLNNLLSNAVKYSPEGGPITVTVGVDTNDTGRWAVVAIADTGIGIPAPELHRVFERFYRASNVPTPIAGTGLGLAGARQIVELHGGSLTVQSNVGQGSVFVVRLPLPEDAAA